MANISVPYPNLVSGQTSDPAQVNANFQAFVAGTSDGTKSFSMASLVVLSDVTCTGASNTFEKNVEITGNLEGSQSLIWLLHHYDSSTSVGGYVGEFNAVSASGQYLDGVVMHTSGSVLGVTFGGHWVSGVTNTTVSGLALQKNGATVISFSNLVVPYNGDQRAQAVYTYTRGAYTFAAGDRLQMKYIDFGSPNIITLTSLLHVVYDS